MIVLAPISGVRICGGKERFCDKSLLVSLKHANMSQTLLVCRTRTNVGDRAFKAAGPRVWNNLPTDLRQPNVS